MKDNVPKKALEEQYDLNALEMENIDEAKKIFNTSAMQNEEQSKALLELRVQELETELNQIKIEKNELDVAFNDEKKRNNGLAQNMINYNTLVDEHLTHVIDELRCFNKDNATFIDKVIMKIKVKHLKKSTQNMQNDLREQKNET